MDIPSVRFLLPCLILYAFYWSLWLNPYVDEGADKDAEHHLSNAKAQRLLSRARQLIAEQRLEDALGPTLELYKAYPENSIYIDQLARIYNKLERWNDEAAMWEQFLVYSPIPSDGCPQIGLAYRRMEREDLAYKAFERCLSLEENSDNLMFMAHALERKGQYKTADELYGKALKRSPGYPDVIIGKARCEIRLGKAAAAKERVLKLLETRADNADALLAAGMACMRTGDYKAARQYLLRGKQVRPRDKDFRLMLARAARQSILER
ncbi:MAG: Beta-barrel assembly-enhancing protease [Bryobacteraceae bacterium]|nr:Beta-barrel assembly-enhancing protease [Bryobacteraceae bacterium]MCC6344610.1 tetratricopeptide repeat protein [Bryobacterales bacterium]